MAPTATDTGGLGLLQLLLQAGIPQPVLAQALMQLLAGPANNQDVGGPSATPGTVDAAGPNADPTANNDPEGTPGNAPGTGGAAVSGAMGGGLIGQGLTAAGVPAPGPVSSAALTLLSTLTGVPSTPLSLTNRAFGAALKAAQHNLRQAGRRVAPIELNGPRTIPDTPPPNSAFNDPANLDPVSDTPVPDVSLSMGLGPGLGPPSGAALNSGVDPSVAFPGPVPTLADLFADIPSNVVDAISAAVAAAGGDNAGGGPAGGGSGAGGGTAAGNSGDASDAE